MASHQVLHFSLQQFVYVMVLFFRSLAEVLWKKNKPEDLFKNSHLQMFFKIGDLKKFSIFRGKTHVLESLFNKVAGLRCFPVNIVKFSRTAFIIEYLSWLLLSIEDS